MCLVILLLLFDKLPVGFEIASAEFALRLRVEVQLVAPVDKSGGRGDRDLSFGEPVQLGVDNVEVFRLRVVVGVEIAELADYNRQSDPEPGLQFIHDNKKALTIGRRAFKLFALGFALMPDDAASSEMFIASFA